VRAREESVRKRNSDRKCVKEIISGCVFESTSGDKIVIRESLPVNKMTIINLSHEKQIKYRY